MSRGDIKFFAAWELAAKAGVSFNLLTGQDSLKLGIVDNSIVPTVGLADPRWGPAGSNDFSAHQVALATSYSGPISLLNATFTTRWSRSAGVCSLGFDNKTLAVDPSGFTDGYWGILYDDTVAGKYAIGFMDLGGPVSIQDGSIVITLNAGGFGTLTAS